jgi:putative acetyltransferase
MNTTLPILRPITVEDNPIIAKIIRTSLEEFKANKPGTVYYDVTTDDLFTVFKAPNSCYFIAELNGAILGGAGIYPTPNLPHDTCELVKLYLTTAARGKGIGKQLIEACMTAALAHGFKKMYLETMPELTIAVPLYEKLGFEYIKAPMGNSGHTGCGIWMLKAL